MKKETLKLCLVKEKDNKIQVLLPKELPEVELVHKYNPFKYSVIYDNKPYIAFFATEKMLKVLHNNTPLVPFFIDMLEDIDNKYKVRSKFYQWQFYMRQTYKLRWQRFKTNLKFNIAFRIAKWFKSEKFVKFSEDNLAKLITLEFHLGARKLSYRVSVIIDGNIKTIIGEKNAISTIESVFKQ